MRAALKLRPVRACALAGLLCSAYALTAGSPLAAGAHPATRPDETPLAAVVSSTHLRYHDLVTVRGRVLSGRPGERVVLEFRPAGAGWRPLRSGFSGSGGSYRLAARLDRSGEVRTEVVSAPARSASSASASARPTPAASAGHPVTVGAAITSSARQLDVLAGRRAQVRGTVVPGRPGRTVTMEVREHHRWHVVGRTHTRAGGRYRLAYATHRLGSAAVRVRFAGDRVNAPSQRPVGRLNVYRAVGASWYDGGGAVACGGSYGPHTLGVANKTLPCGTRVTLRYRGRSVVARVIDRGPYVAGREYDLTAATKRALGFGDTGEVWATA